MAKLIALRIKTWKKDFTIIVGTVFENSKILLSTWIAATFVLTAHKKGISSHQLARDLGCTQKTGWFILQRLRFILDEPNTEDLNNIVEIDETYVGGTFANMNRARRKKWQDRNEDNKVAVMGLLERDGKARLTIIGAKTFKDLVNRKREQTVKLNMTYEEAMKKALNTPLLKKQDSEFFNVMFSIR